MSARDRAILGVVCVIAAIVGPFILAIQPKRDQAAKLQRQIEAEQSQLSGVRAQLAQGAAAKAAFSSSYATLVRLGEAVPTDDNTPSLIYELQSAAQGSRVDFLGLTYDAGQGGSATAPTPTTSPSSSSSSSSSSSTSASTTSSAASTTTSETLPPGAVYGPAGFPIEPFTFTFQGNYFGLANFLGRLQKFVTANNQNVAVSGRLMTLNAVTFGNGNSAVGSPSQLQATISANAYLLPASQGLLNGATPAGPAGSSTQTVSNPSPSSSAPPAVVTAPTLR
jgi:type II secretory pathway pseudopilin PulG